ncbi:MAG: LPS assembly lipoprotein LptE [Bacteroidales bacterium]
MKKLYSLIFSVVPFVATLLLLTNCGIYSFSGTSIQPDINSITVYNIENRAMRINPSLSNSLTEGLKDKYRRLTKLNFMNDGGDLIVEGQITGYETTSISVTAQEVAAQNRLSVTLKIVFTNTKYPEDNFEKNYAAFEDYPSTSSLDAVEARLVESIIEKLIEQIFNDTVANW